MTSLECFTANNCHPDIFHIKHLLFKLRVKNFSIQFLWIPSHMGIVGNEYVDSLASAPSTFAHTEGLPIYFSDLRARDKSVAIRNWQHKWDYSEHGRHLFQLVPRVNIKPWFDNFNFPRKIISLINRLKFNHTQCRDHIYKINLIDSNTCSCGSIQTTNHLLLHCPLIPSSLRAKFFSVLSSKRVQSFDIINLLVLNDKDILMSLYNFFTQAKINI